MIRVPKTFRAARVRSAALAWSLALAVALPRLAAVPTAQAESNDLFRDAAPLLVPGVVRGSTAAATSEVGEPAPSCLPPGYAGLGKTLWYRLSGATAGTISGLIGEVSGFTPVVALYQGSSLATLQEVACGAELQLSAPLQGATYYLQIGGASGMSSASGGADRFASGGSFRIMLSPANDVSMVPLPTRTPSPTPEPAPTDTPTESPTITPTVSATLAPTETPTGVPTVAPSFTPSPTSVPTATPATCPPAPLAGATFSDDFSLDPNTNGKWSIYRYPSADTDGAAVWDAAAKQWYLTRALPGRSAAVFARHALTSTRWEATFRYRTGGGSGADGLVFMFYKDAGYYCDTPYGPYSTGGAMGFQQDPDAIAGYGVEFDTYYNWEFDPTGGPHVALIQDSVRTHVAAAPDYRSTDGLWHQASIRFDSGQLTVHVDGQLALQHGLSAVDYRYTGVGFGAGTGDITNEHVVDDFVLRPLADTPATPTSTATAQPVSTATPTATPTATVPPTATSTPAATATAASLSIANDHFANAYPVSVAPGAIAGPINGTTRNATTESGEPVYAGDWSCYIIGGHRYYSTVWFEITPGASGTLTASTANTGTNFDVALALYEDAPSVGSLGSPVACDNNGDNESPPGSSPQWSSIVRGPVVAGSTYYLQMGGIGGATSGEYALTFELAATQVSTSPPTPTSVPTLAPTSTNTPTNTPAPTTTPTPTNTPVPTATNTPTTPPPAPLRLPRQRLPRCRTSVPVRPRTFRWWAPRAARAPGRSCCAGVRPLLAPSPPTASTAPPASSSRSSAPPTQQPPRTPIPAGPPRLRSATAPTTTSSAPPMPRAARASTPAR